MRYLSLAEVLAIHREVLAGSGGKKGIRDFGSLRSALAQPKQTFGGQDLNPGIVDKAAVLCFGLVLNHPFFDGNKRTGHASMEVFLFLNGFEIQASVEEQESLILNLAAGDLSLEKLKSWLDVHIAKLGD